MAMSALGWVECGDVAAADDMRPAVGVSRPATRRSSVDLPQPEAPTITSISPLVDREIDLAQDLGRAETFAHAGAVPASPSTSRLRSGQRRTSAASARRPRTGGSKASIGGCHHRAPVGLRFDRRSF